MSRICHERRSQDGYNEASPCAGRTGSTRQPRMLCLRSEPTQNQHAAEGNPAPCNAMKERRFQGQGPKRFESEVASHSTRPAVRTPHPGKRRMIGAIGGSNAYHPLDSFAVVRTGDTIHISRCVCASLRVCQLLSACVARLRATPLSCRRLYFGARLLGVESGWILLGTGHMGASPRTRL